MSSIRADPADPTWDVIVVGAGPAGAATALTLAKLGQRVLLAEERVSTSFKLGESLPPSAIGLVKHFLDDSEQPGRDLPGVFRTAGNISLWATEQADVADFFFTSTGFGLCVERLAFDEALRLKAVEAGTSLLKGVRFQSCERIADGAFNWHVSLTGEAQMLKHRARYLVDCSGRRAVVARALGVPTVDTDDQLFAYAQWFSVAGDDDDRYTRIEAGPHGWWYSNRLPGTDGDETRRLVVFHSDKDLPAAKMAARPQGYDQLLDESSHLAPLLKTGGYQPCGTIRGAPAHSQRLQDFCGDAWMAVGDAAQAYDPLSSQGIDKALRTASHAGHMIHYALADCSQGREGLSSSNTYIGQYNEQQRKLWQTYLSQRDYYYGIQRRWSDRPFWQRRRNNA
ncbi:NAD(P)/FAD-dependent oxidoreductase [Pollutimonas thiosulfatoxidans]|uniref:FAD-binding monooxygenase n=1 Tax=Pollutimonas thiosulfatoxidans TaxID=2028345 RepID=A0A410GAB0_9BURK|nr:FAD-dependent monooxygenase [Pollutimonas thiosulfatoxidans]NYT44912.1 FAD-dependent monooxygenase [Alcaligenaceae bacterium]QAA93221.1 FAD-binding monooxygenase [Pollutimonas thiosulfatoxidans]